MIIRHFKVISFSFLAGIGANAYAATSLPSTNIPVVLESIASGNPFDIGLGVLIDVVGATAISGNNSSNWLLTNLGTVQSNLVAIALQSTSVLTNSGRIESITSSAITLSSGGTINNQASGVIRGNTSAIVSNGTSLSINNSGLISSATGPAILLSTGNNIIINTGTINADNGVAIQFGNGNDQLFMYGGVINGNISQGDGIDSIVMTGGQINGSIDQGGDLDDFFISGGLITGNVDNGDRMTMTGGTILGSVRLNQANNLFIMSGGLVQGNVTATQNNDTFIMSNGLINGFVDLGGGNNDLTISGGQIGAGINTGSGNDTLLWQNGGIVIGPITLGAGTNLMTLDNLDSSNLAAVTVFDGGIGGLSTAILSNVSFTNPSRLLNWEQISLTNNTQFEMNQNVVLGDAVSLTGSMSVDSTSAILAGNNTNPVLTAFGNGQLVNLTNAGTIDLRQGIASATDTFTVVGNYVGTGARILLDTVLNADNSPSDKFIISQGVASGDSALSVSNLSGEGALTLGNGILVVEAINGATTGDDSFSLAAPVLAGPYEYNLYKGNADENWYLRSSAMENSEAGLISVPNYRQEVSLYTALPSLSIFYGRTLLDTLHERSGESLGAIDFPSSLAPDNNNGFWLRGLNKDGDWHNKGIVQNGPSFDYRLSAIQGGVDIYRSLHDDKSRDYAGVYGAYGQGRSNVLYAGDQPAGKDHLNGNTLGVYWTHYGTSNWYLNAVMQNTWYDYSASSGRLTPLTSAGDEVAGSLEAGYPFYLTSDVILEPQAQVIYQSLTIDNASDGVAQVRFDRTHAFASRAGLRLASTWWLPTTQTDANGFITGWLRVNGWHEDNGKSIASFSSATGFIPFVSNLEGNWLQTEVGLTAGLIKNVSLYGAFSRDFYMSGHGKAYNASAGVKVALN